MPRKNSHRKDGIFSIFVLIYTVARIFGFMLFAVEYNDKMKISKAYVTICNGLWSVVAIIIYVFVVFVSIYQEQDRLTQSDIEILALALLALGGCAIAVVSIIMDMINRKRICRIVTKLDEFDEKVFLFL